MKDNTKARILFFLAFIIDLLIRNSIGVIISILIASLAMFFFIRSLNIYQYITGIKSPTEDNFVSYTCSIMFLFSNYLSKLLFPFLISPTSLGVTIGFLLISAVLCYLIFWIIWVRTGHKEKYLHPSTNLERTRGVILERTINGFIILAVLSGLDGADLMFLLFLIVSFLSGIYSLIKTLIACVKISITILLQWIIQQKIELTNLRNQLIQKIREVKAKDLEDDLFWDRAFHLIQYREGLAFLVFAFIGSLPLTFFSWAIDFFHFRFEYMIGLLLLVFPAITSFLLVTKTTKYRERNLLILILSFIPPLMSIVVVSIYPDIVPVIGVAVNVVEQNRLRVGTATLLTLLPLFVGIPMLFSISSGEANDYYGFIKWGKIGGFSVFPLFAVLFSVSYFYIDLTITTVVLLLYIAFIIGASFYVFISFAMLGALNAWRSQSNLEITSLRSQLFNPGFNVMTVIPSAAIGISMFLVQITFITNFIMVFLVVFTLSLIVGLLIQFPVTNSKFWTCLWYSSFSTICYLLAYSIINLSFIEPLSFIRILFFSHKLVILIMTSNCIGTIIAKVLLTTLPKYLKKEAS